MPLPALACALLAAAPSHLAALPVSVEQPAQDRVLRDPRIAESSGLAVSGRHEGILWTHNDGSSGRVYAIGPDGRTRAAYRLRTEQGPVQARDWEAMALGRDGGQAVLWVADIGDNRGARTRGILVHRVGEPARLPAAGQGEGELAATSYRLRYPDGPRDAEALLADPRTGRLFVVSKGALGGAVYAAPQRLDPAGPNVLERVADAPGLVTDGTFLPDGRVVLRGYGTGYLLAGLGGDAAEDRTEFVLPEQPQGESVAATPDGSAVLVGSEGARSVIWRVPLPAAAGGGEASPPVTSAPAQDVEPEVRRGDAPRWLRLAAGGSLAVVLTLAAVRSYRHLFGRRRRPRR